MSAPLVAYLDSSDWSNLASAVSPEPFAARAKWLDVRERLLAARDAGKVEFRFSQAIVAEAFPLSARHHDQGVARAQTIVEFCGPFCMRDIGDIVAAETRQLALGQSPPFPTELARSDDGGWFPTFAQGSEAFGKGVLPDPAEILREIAREELPGLGRKKLRQVEALLVDGKGRLLPEHRARLLDPSNRLQVAEMVTAQFGLPSNTPGLDVIARALAGDVPPSAIGEWMIGLLRDLPLLFSLLPARENAEELFGYLRGAGQQVAGAIAQAAGGMRDFVAEFGLDTARRLTAERPWFDTQAWRAKLRERLLSNLWEKERMRRWGPPRVRGEMWFRHVHGSMFGSIPTLDAFIAAGGVVVGKAAVASAQPYRGRVSDVGDITHMAYLPHVDVLRCDRGNAAAAHAVVEELGLRTYVAPTIEDLLAVVGRSGEKTTALA